MTIKTTSAESVPWKKSACILCSLNCGIEVQTGGESGREILKVRGDKAHPLSKGYVCEKTKRLSFYQAAEDRIDSPLRRKPDGSYEQVSWDTAISEISQRFKSIKAQYGGDKILYYGGGGQGNHLGGAYGDATLKALGVKYRSNALAQEKTGEFWVNGKMLGTGVHGDFEHCEVAMFIGKNPWQSHGFSRARAVIREIEKDPKRKMIVMDPRVSETAAKADYHLAVKPGTDAWCLAAIVATLIQEDLLDPTWLAQRTNGYEVIKPIFDRFDIADFAATCGVQESLIREVARVIAKAGSVSVFEDLGLQMNKHSTLGSYIQRFIWLLTGNFGKKGSNFSFVPFMSLSNASKGNTAKNKPRVRKTKYSPVTQSRIIIGLIPCNVIPDEILTDHPDRFRAMIVESGNPVHSLADSQRMREAMRALDFSVVIDVAMTETAREADYVLPASSQYEKSECTFFNLEFPDNAFHLRQPIIPPLKGTLTEAEIHSRLALKMGSVKPYQIQVLKQSLKLGRKAFIAALAGLIATNKKLMDALPILLYKSLGDTLPEHQREAAVLWGVCHMYVQANPQSAANAGFTGMKLNAAEDLFDAILNQASGVVFASAKDYSESWQRVSTAEGKVNLVIPELLSELVRLQYEKPEEDADFPFVLAAGERRSDTSNTIVRNPKANRLDTHGSLRMSPQDAEALKVCSGDSVKVTTRRGSAEVIAEVTDIMQQGHISLPNGFGLDYRTSQGKTAITGVAPNELTCSNDKDFLAGTPWHKYVKAQVEKVIK